MPHLDQKLVKLKAQIEEAKQVKAEAEGAVKQLRQQLKDDHACKDLAAAETKLEKMNLKIEKLNAWIAEGLAALEEEYSV